jgi:hypothetical protein
MEYCPNCEYLLDISKVTESDILIIDDINKLFELIDNKDDLTTYKLILSKEELLKNKKFLKLNKKLKESIISSIINNINYNVYFICNNCNYKTPIDKSIKLYEIDTSNIVTNYEYIKDELILMSKDPLLPHTNNYICINPKCETHKNNDLKNAILYKSNSFKMNYACCICYYNW